MATDDNFLVSIDIGSSKIAILLGEEKEGKISIFGHAKGDSAGVKKGIIVDIEQAKIAIKKVAEKARLNCNTKFHNVSVNISDSNLTIVNQSRQSSISSDKITEEDATLAIENAMIMPQLNNQQIINNIVNHWTLDADPTTKKGDIVADPIGARANILEVNMHIVIVPVQPINNLEKSIHGSDLGLANIVLNSIACSEVYITQDEKDNGICLLDIGAEVTDISVFMKGGIVHNSVINSAGVQITQAIADAFDTTIIEAERLKTTYGRVQIKAINEDQLIKFQQIDAQEKSQCLSHQELTKVIEEAYLELFSHIRQELESKQFYKGLKSGFVLTGGASKMPGCESLLLHCFKTRSKLGRANTDKINANKILLNNPEYGCAMGLLLFEPNKIDIRKTKGNNKKFLGKIKRIKLKRA